MIRTDVARQGISSAAIIACTSDVEEAKAAALAWAAQAPCNAGLTASVYRATPRTTTYHAMGYSGPAVTVTLKFVRTR